jgi:hypothetical protein
MSAAPLRIIMRNRSSVVVAALFLFGSACAVEEGSDSDRVEETAVAPDKAEDPELLTVNNAAMVWANDAALCETVVPFDGNPDACAFACDPEGMKDFIPYGSCMTFRCETSTHDPVKVGGCNLQSRRLQSVGDLAVDSRRRSERTAMRIAAKTSPRSPRRSRSEPVE